MDGRQQALSRRGCSSLLGEINSQVEGFLVSSFFIFQVGVGPSTVLRFL